MPSGTRQMQRRPSRSTRSRKSGSVEWSMSTLDPFGVLSVATPRGAGVVIPNGLIQDMTEPTLVHGWFDGVAKIVASDVDSAAAGYLFVGLRVMPTTVITVAEFPGPFANADGDWLYHRCFPLLRDDQSIFPGTDGTYVVSSVRWHDEVKSARKLHEDENVSYVTELVDADLAAADIFITYLFNFRYLLRQP